jgi:hypothetical protein
VGLFSYCAAAKIHATKRGKDMQVLSRNAREVRAFACASRCLHMADN